MKSIRTILGLIIARGGSRGVPNKNMRLLRGAPLLAHTCAPACESGVLDRVVISTDSLEMANLAADFAVEVPFMRPRNLATDDALSHDVVLHAIGFLEREEGYSPDAIMLLQPTSPLRTAQDIRACATLFTTNDADGVVSVTAARPHPFATKTISNNGLLAPFLPEADMTANRQQWPCAYALNGAIFLRRTSIYRGWRIAQRHDIPPEGTRVLAHIMPPERSVEIDDELDFVLAEALLDKQQATASVSAAEGGAS